MATGNHSGVPEGFKEIPGYAGKYFINEHGHVWSVAKSRLMSPQTDVTHPYPWVLLTKPDKKKQPTTVYFLMRLVWMPPAPGPIGTNRGEWCVNHIDGDKTNSHVSNLEWVTTSENVKHAWRTGLNRTVIGEQSNNSRFTSEQVRRIRMRLLSGEKTQALANELDVNVALIKKMQWFVSWKHQDHDLVEPMMKICQSKWLRVMKTKTENNEPMEECCNRLSRGRTKWNEESLALYL